MSVAGWLGLAESVRGEMSPTEMARRQSEQEDRRAEAEQAERVAAAEDERDARLFRYHAMGIQPGSVLAGAMRAQAEDAEYDDCAAQMRKIEKRRESRRRAAEYQGEQLAAASRASGQPPWVDHANAVAARVDSVQSAPVAQRGRLPFAVRGHAEQKCVHCVEQGVDPETSFLLHADPELAVPVTTQATQVAQVEADRLRALGYSGESARLAAIPFGAGRELVR